MKTQDVRLVQRSLIIEEEALWNFPKCWMLVRSHCSFRIWDLKQDLESWKCSCWWTVILGVKDCGLYPHCSWLLGTTHTHTHTHTLSLSLSLSLFIIAIQGTTYQPLHECKGRACEPACCCAYVLQKPFWRCREGSCGCPPTSAGWLVGHGMCVWERERERERGLFLGLTYLKPELLACPLTVLSKCRGSVCTGCLSRYTSVSSPIPFHNPHLSMKEGR